MSFCVGALALPGPNRDDLYAHNYCVVDFALRATSSAPSTVPLLSTCCAKRRVQSSNAATAAARFQGCPLAYLLTVFQLRSRHSSRVKSGTSMPL